MAIFPSFISLTFRTLAIKYESHYNFLTLLLSFSVGGQEALDQWLKSQEDLVYCVMQNFDITSIQSEVAAKEKTGDLDLVFKKYCG